MWVQLLKSKIHGATITAKRLHYEGSLTLDEALMEAAGLVPYEKVHVLNLNSGARLETYLIPGPPGSGIVQLNGAAARLGEPGDPVILLSYGLVDLEERRRHRPRIVRVDANNRIVSDSQKAEG